MHPVIHIFGIDLHSYGIMMLVGLIAGTGALLFTRKKYGYLVSDALISVVYAAVGGLLGAKLLFIIVEWDSIFSSADPLSAVLYGGYVFYGGLTGVALMELLFAKKRGFGYLSVTDTLLPPVTVAHAVGRIGCFLAGCCYGCETESSLGVVFPPGGDAPPGVKLLPTQLFEAAFLVLLAVALAAILKKERRAGIVSGIYLTAYPVWRFIIEFFRADRRGSIGLLSTSQFISIFVLALGISLIIKYFLSKNKNCRVK